MKSIQDLEKNMEAVLRDSLEMGEEVLEKEILKTIMDKSDFYAPEDTGTLKQSRFIEKRRQGDGTIRVRGGYGGPNDRVNPKTKKRVSSYIVPVHERLDLKHPKGQAKFLERAVNETIPEIEGLLAKNLSGVFRIKR
jgi:hypothetical protein